MQFGDISPIVVKKLSSGGYRAVGMIQVLAPPPVKKPPVGFAVNAEFDAAGKLGIEKSRSGLISNPSQWEAIEQVIAKGPTQFNVSPTPYSWTPYRE